MDKAASYWTSTISGSVAAMGFYYDSTDKNDQMQPNNSEERGRARSVRCVRDHTNNKYSQSLTTLNLN